MRRSVLILISLFLAIAPNPAGAHGGPSESTDIPAQSLAVQALAMLEANMGAMDARDRVEAALRAKNQEDVRIDRLRAADAALGRNDTALARRELEAAFNADDRHLIGTSFTSSGVGRTAAGITGTVLIAGALLLVWRSRSHATPASETPDEQTAER